MKKKRILLALSGGIDSMYLALRAAEFFPGAEFSVAHCNFSLRGKESDEDEHFVRNWCTQNGIACFVKRFDTLEFSKNRGISIEMAARELRYKWFEDLCAEHGFEAVAVAHNADDNAETLILNLLRGTGIKGLRGMDSRKGVLRPLIGTSRAEIRRWMEENRHGWREDSSNADNSFKRNLIRNEIFPLFKKINPSFLKTLNSNMARFAEASDLVEDYCKEVASNALLDDGSISVPELLSHTHWELVLWHLLSESGISAEQFSSLAQCLDSGRQLAGKVFGPVTGASGRLIVESAEPDNRKISVNTVKRSEITSLKQEKGVLILDAECITQPLKIRAWQAGDWMIPLGMRGRKKLSDILSDMHMPITLKAGVQVIELEGSHVAALLCERIDEGVKVSEDTREVMIIKYE